MTPSSNLDLVRSIYADWERGDFHSTEWADPEIEYLIVGGPVPDSWTGLAGMEEGLRHVVGGWAELGVQADEYREVDDERVLVVNHLSGRGKTSGLDLAQIRSTGAALFQIRDGKVTKLHIHWDPDRALADLGLEERAVSEETTTPDLVEIMRRRFEALNQHDIDAVMSFFAPNAVLDVGSLGLHEVGANAIRAFTEDWWGSYEEYENAPEEIVQVGEGIVLVRTTLAGRLPGSSAVSYTHLTLPTTPYV